MSTHADDGAERGPVIPVSWAGLFLIVAAVAWIAWRRAVTVGALPAAELWLGVGGGIFGAWLMNPPRTRSALQTAVQIVPGLARMLPSGAIAVNPPPGADVVVDRPGASTAVVPADGPPLEARASDPPKDAPAVVRQRRNDRHEPASTADAVSVRPRRGRKVEVVAPPPVDAAADAPGLSDDEIAAHLRALEGSDDAAR